MARVHFILGCTAGGKGRVGLELARRFGGQIISVDSMKIYRGMDIGTAKPLPQVRAEIPHHCIDLVDPSETFSVARYLEHADRAVERIASAGDLVLAVGGTALYFKAISQGLFSGPGADAATRDRLRRRAERDGLAALHTELARIDPQTAGRIHPNDEKRIVRALEVYELTGEPISSLQRQWDSEHTRYDCVFIGLRRSRQDANRRINARVKRMVEQGLRDEVAGLLARSDGISHQAAQALGYAEMIDHLRGRCTIEDAIERIKIHTRQFAKRQRTWFRRFREVRWIDVGADTTGEQVADEAARIIEGA
jgi:tRNA dimethylallyltransferase